MSDLYDSLAGAVRSLRLYEDDLATLPDEPGAVLARDVQAALEELLPRLEAVRVEMPYTRGDEPRPGMENERQERREALRADEETAEALAEAYLADNALSGQIMRGRPLGVAPAAFRGHILQGAISDAGRALLASPRRTCRTGD